MTKRRRSRKHSGQRPRSAQGNSSNARHVPQSRWKRALSWVQQTNKVVLGIGAIAVAIGAVAATIAAIVALAPKQSDQNTARFISVQPLSAIPLSDYTQEATLSGLNIGASSHPSAVAAGIGSQLTRGQGSGAGSCQDGCYTNKQQLVTKCTNVNGVPESPTQCASNIAGVLYGESIGRSGPDIGRAASSLLGELISVDMELVGLRGQAVYLSWSIFPQNGTKPLSGNWLGSYRAFRVEPTTDDDTGSLEMWIPLPKQPGQYFVRLALSVDNDGLASTDSGAFG